jgi:maltose O-acetyltransferase
LASGTPFEPEGGFVEDGVVIGAGAVILPVILRKNCVVGAGAVVTKDVAEGDIVVGNPARSIS